MSHEEWKKRVERAVEVSTYWFEKFHAANYRIKRLEEALSLIQPTCECVHHSKKHRHSWSEPCPVVALIEKAKEVKP